MIAVLDKGDGVLLSEIDLKAARARCALGESVFRQRRPELYPELLTDTFSWNPSDFVGLHGHEPLPTGKASRVSVAQFAPGDDVGCNLKVIEAYAPEAKGEGAELAVFPEPRLRTGRASCWRALQRRLPGRA